MELKCLIQNIDAINKQCGTKIAPILHSSETNFYGDSIGILLGIVDVQSNEIIENHMESDAQLLAIMACDGIIKHRITQSVNKQLRSRYLVCLPYRDANSSLFKPTCTDTIFDCDATVEFRLAEDDGLTRTFLAKVSTYNVSPIDIVHDAICDLYSTANEDDVADLQSMLLNADDCSFQLHTEECDDGFCIDYYDELGNRICAEYTSGEEIWNHVVSIRIINIDYHCNK